MQTSGAPRPAAGTRGGRETGGRRPGGATQGTVEFQCPRRVESLSLRSRGSLEDGEPGQGHDSRAIRAFEGVERYMTG